MMENVMLISSLGFHLENRTIETSWRSIRFREMKVFSDVVKSSLMKIFN